MNGPPLGLGVVVQTPDGRAFRWDAGQPQRDRRLSGLRFRTRLNEGFSEMSCTLARSPETEWPDLIPYSTIRAVGLDGTVAYEGRLATSHGQGSGRSGRIGVRAEGWMAHVLDRPLLPYIYVDSDFRKWGGMPNAAKAVYHTGGTYAPADGQVENEGVVTRLAQPPWGAGAQAVTEAWYAAPPGAEIGLLTGNWAYFTTMNMSADGNYAIVAYLSPDDAKNGAYDNTGDLQGTAAAFSVEASDDRTHAVLQLFYGTTSGTADNEGRAILWTALRVYGPHKLTPEADGSLRVTDVLRHLIANGAPLLDASRLADTDAVIDHAVVDSPQSRLDFMLAVNAHDDRRNLAVWTNRQITNKRLDFDTADWRVHTADPGVSVKYQDGEAGDRLTGIVVSYTDATTNLPAILTPDDDERLADRDPTIPGNVIGIDVWETVNLPNPITAEQATRVASSVLKRYNAQRRSAVITVRGYIRDGAGHMTQPWRAWAEHMVVVEDEVGAAPRLITETEYDDDSRTLTMTVDANTMSLDALVAASLR